MSEENVEIARRSYSMLSEALKTGVADPSALEATWTPDCVLRPSGLLPESAEVYGHEGIARHVAAQLEAFEEMRVEALDFLDAGDRIVVPVRFGGRARHTGIEVNFMVAHVLTVRDGKIARLDMFRDTSEALEAVGLTG